MAKGTMGGDVSVLVSKHHIKVGDKLKFKADTMKWEDFELSEITKGYKVISAVPSVDTDICLLQTKEFNEKIVAKYPDVQLMTISRDLPFALSRACKSFINENHLLLSDANYRDFGNHTKLFFDFNNLLARSVLVLDKEDRVVYLQLVSPVSSEPNYNDVYEFLDTIKN